MKKTQVALAALALVASSAAMAQVTVSGYVDVGAQKAQGNSTAMVGGLIAPNVLNVAGTEDLGNGLKGDFFLQTRFEVPNGLSTYSVNSNDKLPLFNQSYVGLSGDFGALQIGRNVDAFWGNAAGAFDVTGGNNMGSFVGSVINKGASGVFVDNQVKYALPSIGGLNAAVSYTMQDSTNCAVGACTKGDYSIGATYGMGALSVGLGFADRDVAGTGSTRVKATFIGAGYDFEVAKVNVVYLDGDQQGKTYGVNARVPLTGALSLNAGYYKDDAGSAGAADGRSAAIGANYALSKRTNLFANYQKVTGTYGLNVGLSDGNALTTGAKNALTIGVGHSF